MTEECLFTTIIICLASGVLDAFTSTTHMVPLWWILAKREKSSDILNPNCLKDMVLTALVESASLNTVTMALRSKI